MFLLFLLLFAHIFVAVLAFRDIRKCSHYYITREHQGIFIKIQSKECLKCGENKETIFESYYPFNIYNDFKD